MRIARSGLFALLGVALLLAGCESAPEAPKPETKTPEPEPSAPKPAADGVAWAVGQAPADACLVGAVASMADLEKNLKALVGPDGDDMNLVQELDKELVAGGLDAAGPLVFILPAGEEPAPVLLLRIKDEAAIKGEKATAGILATERDGATGYVLKMGAWAACADSADAIKAIMRAEKKVILSADQAAAVAKHTVWVHLNPASLAAVGKRFFDKAQQEMAKNPQAPQMPQTTLKMMNWILDVAKDATRIGVAADVKPQGITADFDVDLAEGSNLLAIANSGVPVKDFKAGLPTTPGLILAAWGGMDWGKAVPAMKTLIKPMFDIIAEGEDEKTRKALDNALASYEKWGAVMGNRFGMVMELPKPGTGMYQLAETFTIKDPDQYRKVLKEYMESAADAMNVMMSKFMAVPGAPQAPNVKGETEYKEAAETIEGVPVDVWRIKFDVSLPPDTPPEAAKQMKAMFDAIYGPEGMTFRMATVGNVAIATMGDPGVMARTIKAVKGEAPDLSADPKVAAALKRIPAGEGAALMSAANYMYLAMGMLDTMMTANLPPEVKAEAEKAGIKPLAAPPPTDFITFSGGGEGPTVRVHVDVPQDSIRAAVSVGKQGAERMKWFMEKQQEMAKEQMERSQVAPE